MLMQIRVKSKATGMRYSMILLEQIKNNIQYPKNSHIKTDNLLYCLRANKNKSIKRITKSK
jgi:hypothetical protein